MSENKEYVTRCEEQGNVYISEEVLAGISAAAALEIEGVSGLTANLGSDIAELLGKKSLAKGVSVKTEEDKVGRHFCRIIGFLRRGQFCLCGNRCLCLARCLRCTARHDRHAKDQSHAENCSFHCKIIPSV